MPMSQILALVGSITMFVLSIVILVAAFKKSVGTGFLCLCIPFYIYFFVFARYQSPKKKLMISLWLGAHVLYIIGFVLMAKAQLGTM